MNWNQILETIFKNDLPQTRSWKDDDVYEILVAISKSQHHNHAYYPAGGGNDLIQVSRSKEGNSLNLQLGNDPSRVVNILPNEIHFYNVRNNPRESYFILTTIKRSPVFKGIESAEFYEEPLVELASGKFRDNHNFQEAKTNETYVDRQYNPGSYAFFSKDSKFNRSNQSYDGLHNELSLNDFYDFIKDLSGN